MTTTFIDTIPILPFGSLNAFLVVHNGKAMLVDTGLPGSEPKIRRALIKRGLDWGDITHIVLTHAHIDHAGSASAIKKLSNAPITAHAGEVAYCAGAKPLLRPKGVFGRLFAKTGLIERQFAYFTPDIVISGADHDLTALGFPARIVFTPGHTPGSLSVVFENGDVIAGDLAASGILLGGIMLRGRPKQPPFEEDSNCVCASLEHLLQLGGRRFFLGHGGPLSAKTVAAHIAKLRAKM